MTKQQILALVDGIQVSMIMTLCTIVTFIVHTSYTMEHFQERPAISFQYFILHCFRIYIPQYVQW